MDTSEQKVCLVTGGSRGLGAAIVQRFLDNGYRVATFSRSSTDFVKELCDGDPEHERFYWEALDGTDTAGVQRFVKTVTRQYGRIDVLINNAAIGIEGLFALMQPKEIARGIDVNLTATVLLTQAVTKQMFRQQSGAIVFISSVNAVRGHSGVAVYSATKAALDGMTRSLARELGPRHIRVNSVAPGYFESEMVKDLTDAQRSRIIRRTPLGRLADVGDIVNTIFFFASPSASFITGQTLVVDGGITS